MLRTFPRAVIDWLGLYAETRSENATAGGAGGEPLSPRELGTAIELFSRLAEITASVGAEVRNHSGNIQSVNDELTVIPQGDVSAVAAVVGKLLVMNQQTQQRLAQAEIRLQAQQRQLADVTVAAKTDALTGLMNRRALDEELRRVIAEFQQQGRPATLLLLDVDHFKRFNDTHGHPAGDQALKLLADVLLAHARESDVVARYGGEEFAVIFRGAKAASVCQRAENMRNAIGQSPIPIEHSALRITASSGLTEIQVGDDPEKLIKRADEALYASKLDGRDCGYWYADDKLQRIGGALTPGDPLLNSDPAAHRAESVQLAPDQFADATFIGQITRRIAEWRRGGTTFSVLLARVEFPAVAGQPPLCDESRRTALRIVQQFARASLRDMDLLTRWQDDGLAILLPGSLVTDAAGVATRLRTAIERYEMPAQHGLLSLAFHAGVAEVVEGNDAQRVLRRAWLALDAACQAGPGSVCLHDGLRPMPAGATAAMG
jgi:diguanylate cyclase (GGDEF)-like protein